MKVLKNELIKLVKVSKRIQQFLIVFGFLMTLGNTSYGQEQPSRIAIDSSTVTVMQFTENLDQKYTGSDFDYEYTKGEGQNILARIIYWFVDLLNDTFGVSISRESTEIAKTIIYVLLIIFAIYVCLKVFMGNEVSSFFSKPTASMTPIAIHDEEIETLDFEALIREALAQREYRLAIRYLYLKALRELSSNACIEYHVDKTNTTYISEIEDVQLRQQFTQASYIYEHAWYGEFEVNEVHYSQFNSAFEQLFTSIRTHG